jgi:hypothetical protein
MELAMKVQRIIPDCMLSPKEVMEAAVEQAAITLGPIKTTARVENIIEGKCPICKVQMSSSTANNLQVLYCPEHSLVMPIRDPEPLSVQ